MNRWFARLAELRTDVQFVQNVQNPPCDIVLDNLDKLDTASGSVKLWNTNLPALARPAVRDAGHPMLLLQRWGASPREAPELVARLIAVAGPHRVGSLDELLTHMDRHWRQSGARKIEWLQEQADRMAALPLYWPRFRLARRTKRSDWHRPSY
jgi:hypothetical protein